MWCKNNCDGNPAKFRKKMPVFLDYIQFKYIPCDVLVKDVYPLKIVPNFTMIKALAHQVGGYISNREGTERVLVMIDGKM